MIFNVKCNDTDIICGDLKFTTYKEYVNNFQITGVLFHSDLESGYDFFKKLDVRDPFTITIYNITNDIGVETSKIPNSIILEGCRVKHYEYRLRENCVDIFGEYLKYNEEY